jgi:hypothetical protein
MTYIETAMDQLAVGDWIDADRGIAEVTARTDRSVRVAYFTPRVRFATPQEYTQFDPAFRSTGDEWDGGVRCVIGTNQHLFRLDPDVGQTYRLVRRHRGQTRSVTALKIQDKRKAIWSRDFYLG